MHRLLIAVIIALSALLLYMLFSSSGQTYTSDEPARFLYLVLFAALIGSGILASRRSLSETARQLGLWVVIILGLAVAYIFRGDVQQIASRVTAGLIPGRAAVVQDENGFNTVLLYRAENGHFVADTLVNGSPVTMLVDTGATTIALSYEDAVRAGLNPQTLDFNSMVMTANGPARSASVTLSQVSVGGIERTNIRAGIAEPGKLGQSLLGMNFLGSLSGFSFSGDELKLRD